MRFRGEVSRILLYLLLLHRNKVPHHTFLICAKGDKRWNTLVWTLATHMQQHFLKTSVSRAQNLSFLFVLALCKSFGWTYRPVMKYASFLCFKICWTPPSFRPPHTSRPGRAAVRILPEEQQQEWTNHAKKCRRPSGLTLVLQASSTSPWRPRTVRPQSTPKRSFPR